MCGGGAKGAAPTAQYVDPVTGKSFWKSDDLNLAINGREERQRQDEASAKAAAEAKAAQERADAQTKFNTARGAAFDYGRTSAQDYFVNQGVDPESYMSQIDQALHGINMTIPDLDPNPGGYFAKNPGIDIFTNAQQGAQSKAITGLNQVFGGDDFATKLLGDDLLDPTVDKLTDERFNPLYSQLDIARKRGTLNDVGFSAALDKFNTDKGTARSTIRNAASTELTNDRAALKGIKNEGLTSASNLRLGDSNLFDPSSYFSQAQGQADRERGSFFDDVGNALVGTEFSNLTDLLNAGGAVQGGMNPTAGNPGGATSSVGGVDDAALSELRKRRQLANQGAF